MAQSIDDWLREIGMPQHAALFADNDIDEEVLLELDDADLRELGLSLGHRKKLLREIRRRREALETSPLQETFDPALPSEAVPSPPAPKETSFAPEVERRQLTVLFCDLVGSATISERLDPEDLRELLSAYYLCCSKAIERYGGHIAKYLGDGIDAYFGYPSALEDAAVRAVLAGLQIVRDIEGLNSDLKLPDVQIEVRLGIHSGIVVTGSIGEGTLHEELGIVGDVPVIASRLQTLAEPGGVLVSEATKRLVNKQVALQDFGVHRLKGVAEPQQIYVALAESLSHSVRDRELLGDSRDLAVPSNPFIGREAEVSILMESWQRCQESSGQAVLISGEPGIGKSRIIEAVLNQINGQAPPVLEYHCSPYLTNSALHPVVEQLRKAAGFEEDDSAEAKLNKLESYLTETSCNIGDSAPFLSTLLSLPGEERYGANSLTPVQERQRIQDTLIAQIEAHAGSHPPLMLFEDVHWADPTTMEFLKVLVMRLQAMRVLLIMTARPEFRPPWQVGGHVITLSLGRLNRERMTAMVHSLAGDKTLPAGLTDLIIDRAGGIPLFIEELTRHLLESPAVTGGGPLDGSISHLRSLPIPDTLQDSLMARLDRLPRGKPVAQIAAAVGRNFSYGPDREAGAAGQQRARRRLERAYGVRSGVSAGLRLECGIRV